jgi:hypothetical protein
MWGLMGVGKGRDSLASSIKSFNPDHGAMLELLSLMREELPPLNVAVTSRDWQPVDYHPDEWFEDDTSGVFIRGGYRFEPWAEKSREPLDYEDYALNPSSYEQCYVDRNIERAFREYFSPWIAVFLFNLAARQILGKETSSFPEHARGQILDVPSHGKPVLWELLSPEEQETRWRHLVFFEAIAWYSVIDYRPGDKKKRSPQRQIRERMSRLWPHRDVLTSGALDLVPSAPRVASDSDRAAGRCGALSIGPTATR